MKLYTLVGICTLILALSQCKPQEEKPNILWIVSEDNSPLLGCYGDSFATTPVLDHLAQEGVLYSNAFATAPVCAPSRSTLITGMYPPSLGTENMRSTYPIPDYVKFYPKYLKEAGYYTTNNSKKDYNTTDQPEAWDESGPEATYLNRPADQPFFAIFNLGVSHESSVHESIADDQLKHDPKRVPIPPYHPRTPEMEHDWAQYYDKVQNMDTQVGEILEELTKQGLDENTIVFYYSDHGGVLGRSKRFMYESGLKIPLIVRFPKKYAHLAPDKPGSKTDRIVTFLDFAPTLLSLVGVQIPDYMQGTAFLGKQAGTPREYAHAFRGRMDERIDLSRSVRNKQYRYIRNYMPHKIYGQYLEYLWKAPSLGSCKREYDAGRLNDIQSKFWQTKPAEELFDIEKDPHNVHNLAEDPEYAEVLNTMRQANHDWVIESNDIGFMPEGMLSKISEQSAPMDYKQKGNYDIKRVLETAEMASSQKAEQIDEIVKRLSDPDPVVRYWAVIGTIVLNKQASKAKEPLKQLLQDQEITVRIAAAESLYQQGEKAVVYPVLKEALTSPISMVRVQALNVLELMGEEAKPVLKDIEALLKGNQKDSDYDMRAANRIIGLLK
ncbi:arylsulfatase A-like enzyme [Dyadobacter jejuensis]|uniref:Arylsulfatase A-like enzyme n=1 Tax=Dyadobacter jejuensis TaxID=1082580 RepID=A0A316AP83_9BACT|nr:sulfatase-like hydrolase/transferase [Dyadobacter jejuensis]PWJ59513.1 arylsulfatase A-like enzyme [Dyadobacter jejuensis]